VRKLIAVLALAALGASAASAQQSSWNTEIGLQGGYSRLKPAGTGVNDYVDVFDVPGANGQLGATTYNSFFAILKWKEKIALEPSMPFGALAGQITTVGLGLRADYALSPKFYLAGGGVMGYIATGGITDYQLGLQVAAGYRLRVTGRINGRLEANWITTKATDVVGAANVYSLLFGVSTRL